MVPWNKMPRHLQRAILAMIAVFGGSSAACRLLPLVCDPPPPPSSTPSPTMTPMICDPPPPPSSTPSPTVTPMICDPPPPPPSSTPSQTVTPMLCNPPPPRSTAMPPIICDPAPPPPSLTEIAPGRHFTPKTVQVSSDASVDYAVVKGRVVDEAGQPFVGISVAVHGPGWKFRTTTGSDGAFSIVIPQSPMQTVTVGSDEDNALDLELKLHDVATIEWVAIESQSQRLLPLAQARTVDIAWQEGLTFAAESAWPGARYQWTVSGGMLVEQGEQVAWHPPTAPGRYLLQVVADWGYVGLAVDAVVLQVEEDGSVILC
jgi:hypothetical protein